MDDGRIVELLLSRSEAAIAEMEKKYGARLRSLAYRITGDRLDAEECVNDAYLGVWNSVPPNVPSPLFSYLTEVVRRTSYKRIRSRMAQKRAGVTYSLSDYENLLAYELEFGELRETIDEFVLSLPEIEQEIFRRRFVYSDSYSVISGMLGISTKSVSVRLTRMREKMRKYLTERGYMTEKDHERPGKDKTAEVKKTYTFTVIEGEYDSVGEFSSEGLAYVLNYDGSCGYIDRTGRLVIPMKYKTPVQRITVDGEECFCIENQPIFSGGLACVADESGKFGYIDAKGECVLPFVYDDAASFCGDGGSYAKVTIDGRDAFIDRRGKIIFWFDEIERDKNPEDLLLFDGELICVIRGGKLGYLNVYGETVIPFIYDDPWKKWYPSFFSEGLLPVARDGKWGYVDRLGCEVIPPVLEYDNVGSFSSGVAVVTVGELEDVPLPDVHADRVGFFRAQRRRHANMRRGMIDRTGKLVAPLEYTRIWYGIHNGHILAERGDETCIIDTKGNVIKVIDGYDFVHPAGGYLRAEADGLTTILDYDGNVVIPPKYAHILPHDGHAIITDKGSGKRGIIGLDGEVIVPLEFDLIEMPDSDGYCFAERGGVRGILHFEKD